jgi:hypothetical protein
MDLSSFDIIVASRDTNPNPRTSAPEYPFPALWYINTLYYDSSELNEATR